MSANLKFKSTPVRERVSKEEWDMRVNLAAAYQLGALYKWTDLIYTHFSARVPGTEDFLINPYGMMFDEITASNLVKIDLDGKIVDDPHAMRVQPEITYHDYEGVALYKEEQERMARDLGRKSKAMILRNHGLLALGDTVREAFEIMYYLDAACQIQVDACAGGLHNVQLMSDDAAKKSYDRLSMTDHPRAHRDWPALLRLLDRRGIRDQD